MLWESNIDVFRQYWVTEVDACCFSFFSCKCWQNAVVLLYILTQGSAWGSLHIYKTFASIWILAGSYYSNSLARCSKDNCKSTWLCGRVRPLISAEQVWKCTWDVWLYFFFVVRNVYILWLVVYELMVNIQTNCEDLFPF